MKKMTTFLMAMVITFGISACGQMAEAESKGADVGAQETVNDSEAAIVENNIEPVQGIEDVQDYESKSVKENLVYCDDTTKYYYNGYEFERFESFLTILPEGRKWTEDLIISGSQFVLADDGRIWFINNERQISSFDYQNFAYAEANDSLALLNDVEEYVVYCSADYKDEIKSYFRYDKYLEVKGTTAITADFPYTVIVDGNKVTQYKNGKYVFPSTITFPFEIEAISYTTQNHWEKETRVNFISDTGVVGQLILSSEGIDYNVIDASEGEKSLYVPAEKDCFVLTQRDWVVFEKDGKIVASDGELTFSIDDLDYKEMWFGDACGIGQGYEELAAVFTMTDYDDLDTMSIVQLVEKYIKK